jgi:hypothetical protein
MHFAVLGDHPNCVRFLLEQNARVDIKTKEGQTAHNQAQMNENWAILAIMESHHKSQVSKLCAVCHKPAGQYCSACHHVFYCCREHQKSDWKYHKLNCKK